MDSQPIGSESFRRPLLSLYAPRPSSHSHSPTRSKPPSRPILLHTQRRAFESLKADHARLVEVTRMKKEWKESEEKQHQRNQLKLSQWPPRKGESDLSEEQIKLLAEQLKGTKNTLVGATSSSSSRVLADSHIQAASSDFAQVAPLPSSHTTEDVEVSSSSTVVNPSVRRRNESLQALIDSLPFVGGRAIKPQPRLSEITESESSPPISLSHQPSSLLIEQESLSVKPILSSTSIPSAPLAVTISTQTDLAKTAVQSHTQVPTMIEAEPEPEPVLPSTKLLDISEPESTLTVDLLSTAANLDTPSAPFSSAPAPSNHLLFEPEFSSLWHPSSTRVDNSARLEWCTETGTGRPPTLHYAPLKPTIPWIPARTLHTRHVATIVENSPERSPPRLKPTSTIPIHSAPNHPKDIIRVGGGFVQPRRERFQIVRHSSSPASSRSPTHVPASSPPRSSITQSPPSTTLQHQHTSVSTVASHAALGNSNRAQPAVSQSDSYFPPPPRSLSVSPPRTRSVRKTSPHPSVPAVSTPHSKHDPALLEFAAPTFHYESSSPFPSSSSSSSLKESRAGSVPTLSRMRSDNAAIHFEPVKSTNQRKIESETIRSNRSPVSSTINHTTIPPHAFRAQLRPSHHISSKLDRSSRPQIQSESWTQSFVHDPPSPPQRDSDHDHQVDHSNSLTNVSLVPSNQWTADADSRPSSRQSIVDISSESGLDSLPSLSASDSSTSNNTIQSTPVRLTSFSSSSVPSSSQTSALVPSSGSITLTLTPIVRMDSSADDSPTMAPTLSIRPAQRITRAESNPSQLSVIAESKLVASTLIQPIIHTINEEQSTKASYHLRTDESMNDIPLWDKATQPTRVTSVPNLAAAVRPPQPASASASLSSSSMISTPLQSHSISSSSLASHLSLFSDPTSSSGSSSVAIDSHSSRLLDSASQSDSSNSLATTTSLTDTSIASVSNTREASDEDEIE